ncbi:FAD-binding protein [Aquicoccus sp. SCR17]|nr:FAD-binding protein [Carideicomes alvinocaridis]
MTDPSSREVSEALAARVGAAHVLTDPRDTAPYFTDWTGRAEGRALCVCRPGSVAEVSEVLRYCSGHGIPVFPQGGNTSSVAGGIPGPEGKGVLLSLSRLARVDSVDTDTNCLIAGAGCTLEQVRAAAEAAGRLFPLTLASQGSCQIGGNVSTNEGGTAVLRYGNTRDLVLGLEMVLADGRVWNGLRSLRKDNSGYDMKSLFVGAEGTLGIVTRVALKLFPPTPARAMAFAALPSPAAAVTLLGRLRSEFGQDVDAAELFSGPQLDIIARHVPGVALPFAPLPDWAVMIDIQCARDDPTERLHALLAELLDSGLLLDAVPALGGAQAEAFWKIRHGVSEANRRHGLNFTHDIAVPISAVPEVIARCEDALARHWPEATPHTVAHLGDGNVHFTAIFPPERLEEPGNPARLGGEVAQVVHDIAVALGGSFAAEHGIGQRYRASLRRYKSEIELEMFRSLKAAFDPQDILNPGKLL